MGDAPASAGARATLFVGIFTSAAKETAASLALYAAPDLSTPLQSRAFYRATTADIALGRGAKGAHVGEGAKEEGQRFLARARDE